MFVGYARVSSTEQETALQLDALRRAVVVRVFQEKRSAVARRPELERLLYSLRAAALCAACTALSFARG